MADIIYSVQSVLVPVDYIILSSIRSNGVHNLFLNTGDVGVKCRFGIIAQGIDGVFKP